MAASATARVGTVTLKTNKKVGKNIRCQREYTVDSATKKESKRERKERGKVRRRKKKKKRHKNVTIRHDGTTPSPKIAHNQAIQWPVPGLEHPFPRPALPRAPINPTTSECFLSERMRGFSIDPHVHIAAPSQQYRVFDPKALRTVV
jgi:hypothetical protein